ncbi:MAG: methyltransferase domain-containing protein [Nanopusillaceae archaeon]
MIIETFIGVILLFFVKTWVELVKNEAIFIPLPINTVRKIMKAAKISKKDIVFDLGCGDGRVVIIAAKEFGCKCIGIEKSYILSKIAEFRVKKEKLENRIKIINDDFFNINLRKATVIFVYLSSKLNKMLEPKLKRELRNGTLILSASHKFNNFKLIKKIKTGHFYSYIYRV